MKAISLPKFTFPVDPDEFAKHLNSEEGKLSELLNIHPKNGTEQENATYFEVTLYTSHQQNHYATLSANSTEVTGTHPDGADRLSLNSEMIAEFMRISTKAKDQLMMFVEDSEKNGK